MTRFKCTSSVKTLLVGLAFCLSAVQPVFSGEVEKAVEYRQGYMNVLAWNTKAMGEMMKGKKPYDQAAFARHAKDIASVASLDLLPGFPEDSESEDSDALTEIWMDFEDFEKKYQNFREASKKLNEVAATGDKATTGAAFKELGKSCKSCHKTYKN